MIRRLTRQLLKTFEGHLASGWGLVAAATVVAVVFAAPAAVVAFDAAPVELPAPAAATAPAALRQRLPFPLPFPPFPPRPTLATNEDTFRNSESRSFAQQGGAE